MWKVFNQQLPTLSCLKCKKKFYTLRSTVKKGYYQDELITEMTKKTSKSFLPIINRGTWSRVYSITNSVQKILKELKEFDPNISVNIINLGCGFDTFFLSLRSTFDNYKYYEFDYSEIATKKIELIKKSEKIKNLIGEFEIKSGSLYSKFYYLLQCDCTDYQEFNKILCSISDFDFSSPTIVISECLLVYLKKEVSYKMLHNMTNNFKNLIFLEYDLVGAEDNFGKEMIINLLERDIRLYGYEDCPNVESQRERLIKSGFLTAEVCDMLTYYEKIIPKLERAKIESKEFVDELEEWNLLQSHACFGYGIKLDQKYEFLSDLLKFELNN
jgi:hypothetical protein